MAFEGSYEYFVGGFLASGFNCCCFHCVCDRNKKMNKKEMVTKIGVGTFWLWEHISGMNLGFEGVFRVKV